VAAAGGAFLLLTGRGEERPAGANIGIAATPSSLLLRARF
jgi:hypothetical protein